MFDRVELNILKLSDFRILFPCSWSKVISWSAKSKIFSLVKIRKFVNVREESGETKQTKAKELSERQEKGERASVHLVILRYRGRNLRSGPLNLLNHRGKRNGASPFILSTLLASSFLVLFLLHVMQIPPDALNEHPLRSLKPN